MTYRYTELKLKKLNKPFYFVIPAQAGIQV